MKNWMRLLLVLLVLSLTPMAAAAESVQPMIDGLPTVEQFQALEKGDPQREAYARVQEAYDAYMALSQEERSEITGAEERFEELFTYFNAQIMPIENPGKGGKLSYNGTAWAVCAGLVLPVLFLAWKKK